ncbi:Pls/PosA family non-ribosomal peptide synthetase [Actinocrispum wychmicini]|uniref:Non-ribosomal peptide synthetase-like protein n=1 Tax=Actinocrispum wychmicini TaxID=1213861 RepID=A0A4R2J3B0_9PSEU|nr:Pls/PosA family non-ribosomal peptide synthetase [Actinocrispum wychmicini]TCO50859.1 non-ribosomal peptide synthetase-like protein [Actinocrispum wychmicini]
MTLLEVFESTVARHPAAPALADSTVELTYAQLAASVRDTASTLRAAGVGAGDRVGIRIPSGCVDLYVSILATLSVGAAYVPVDFDDPDERAETVWAEAGVATVIGPSQKITGHGRGVTRRPTPDDDAWIIFTSGSTGTPKGVAITHRSATAFVEAEAKLFCQSRPLGPGDRVLAALSVAFDASCEEMWLAWRHGACLVAAPRDKVRSGADFGEWILDHEITVVSTVPTLAALWPSLDGVRLLILGGEACPPELVTRVAAPGREVWNTYGPTEATVVACAAPLVPGEQVRIGLPLAGWDLAVVGPDGRRVWPGEVGELVIGGVGLGRYLDPVRDAERYRPMLGWDRAYRTGDLVRADPEGLVFVGRADDQVKISGRRVELGEIDTALGALPGVVAAAAAVRNGMLIGYVVAGGFDPGEARRILADRLPAGLVPRLVELPSLPMKTSGKVDRDALPWPVKGEAVTYASETETWLAGQWAEVLGVQVGRDDNFFDLGGGSLAAARLVSALRQRFPTVAVLDVYDHPTLPALAAHLDELMRHEPGQRTVMPTPRRTGVIQALVHLVLATLTGVKWVLALLLLDNLMALIDPEPWTPTTSWWVLLGAWALLVSPVGRLGIVLGTSRLLRRGIQPGEHPRGGRVHLRLWTMERVAGAFGLAGFAGTHWAARYAKALGCKVGANVDLHALPPVTGMATFGDRCAVEPEADLAGWWLDGDVLHVGEIYIGADARVGARSTLLPGAKVPDGTEVTPGSCVTATDTVSYQGDWPAPRQSRPRGWNAVYTASMIGLGALPLLVSIPWMLLGYQIVRNDATLGSALGHLLIITPLATVAAVLSYAMIVVLLVRLAGLGITAGTHPAHGRVAWCVWLTDRLVRSARVNLFPLYASLATPAWLRALGAKVGRRVEASTVVTMPRLTHVADGGFLADDGLLAPFESRGGWLRLGRVHVGERAFLGNSGILGPGRHVPAGALIGVLSSAPDDASPGSSWLGRPAMELPRVADPVDSSRTFDPPARLVLARAAVEACRLVPIVLSALLATMALAAIDEVNVQYGLWAAAAVSGGVLVLAGVIACALTTLAKWLLVGRFRPGQHPLWSSFVWRNELFDCFVEQLAVPWLLGSSPGTPWLNTWLRSLGARIGKGVWCETHSLPETDLVRVDAGASVNRGCVLQTHLFHDRLMRLDNVHVHGGATLGPHSIALPGSAVGTTTTVGPGSLVMRGEALPGRSRWIGNPVRSWSGHG